MSPMSEGLIEETWGYGSDSTIIEHQDLNAMRDLLLGRRVSKIAADHMRLDNGTVVKIVPNEGCGGCSAGNYALAELNEVDNIITAVELVVTEAPCGGEWCGPEHDWCERDTTYSVFVVAEDRRMNLFAVDGNDGSGYYGSGFWLLVRGESNE